MKTKKIEKNGYNLHLIKTNNFKTILVKVIFWEKMKKEELTLRSMLINNLLFSSKRYKTSKEMTIKKEDLYGISMGGGSYRKGNYIFSELSLSVIEEKYTERGIFEKSLEFFFDSILDPNVINDSFDKETFEINYERLKTDINMTKENPSLYSFLEYKKKLGKDKPFATLVEGDMKHLEKITPENLYDYYKKFLNTNNIDVIIVGNIDTLETEELVSKMFKVVPRKLKTDPMIIEYEKEFTEDIIKSEFSQSRLIMGGTLKSLTEHEKRYELLAYNIILGNSPNSKLFKNIREAHSYAYSISSNLNRLDGLFYINAGISKENYQDVKKEILNELENMKRGKFTIQDLKNSKEALFGVLKEINDYQGAIADHYFNELYLNSDTVEVQTEEIRKLTKEKIIEVAKKINIDTILLIEEKDYGKN